MLVSLQVNKGSTFYEEIVTMLLTLNGVIILISIGCR